MGLGGAFEVAKAWVTLGVNTKPLQAGLDDAEQMVTGGVKGIQSKVGGLLAAVGAGLAVGKLVGALSNATRMAEEQINAQLRMAAVIKATGNAAGFTAEEVQKQAKAFSKGTTFSVKSVNDLQAVLLTFKNISGPAFTATTEAALDMATVLQTDAKSAAIQLGKAMNDPITGAGALKEAGIAFTAVQLEQIRTMQESGDLFGAQAVLLKELSGEFGGLAREMAEGPTGQAAQMRNEMDLLWAGIGEKLLPIMFELSQVMHGFVVILDAAISGVINLTGRFGGLDAGAHQTVIGIAAFVAGFLGVVVIVPVVIKAITAIRAALLALQAATFVGIATAVASLAAGAALAVAATSIVADDIKEAQAAADLALQSQGAQSAAIANRHGGGTGGQEGKAIKKQGVSLGFTGLEEMGRKIQESLFDQKADARQEEMLQLSRDNAKVQTKLLDSTNAVRRNTEKGGGGLVKGRGTI